MRQCHIDIRDWVIYKIESPVGRIYVGKTISFDVRMRAYRNISCNQQKILYRSLKKYGFENHKIEIIDRFKSDNEYASGKEIFWIRSNMSNFRKYPKIKGMNLTDGGDGVLGTKMSESARKKMSKAAIGRTHNRGRVHSEETREKNRQAQLKRTDRRTGYHWNEEAVLARREWKIKTKGKAVIQIDKNGDLVNEFRSIGEAARNSGYKKSTIFNLINRTKSPKGDFTFKYKV